MTDPQKWETLGDVYRDVLDGIHKTMFGDFKDREPFPERLFEASAEADVLSEHVVSTARDHQESITDWITAFAFNYLHSSVGVGFWTDFGNELLAFAHGFGWVAVILGMAYGEGRAPLDREQALAFLKKVEEYYDTIGVNLVHREDCGHDHSQEIIDNPFKEEE